MTREDIKTITDIVHKTIYGFFDVCGDDEETPITDKDELLLSINKAICTNIKALKQQPCGDVATFKEDVLDVISRIGLQKSDTKEVQAVAECLRAVEALPPVNPQKSCNTCKHSNETDGSSCYECVKGMKDNYDSQEPKMGRWIFVDKAHEHAHCSECDYGDVDLLDGRPHNYCPNCGSYNGGTEE